LKKVLESPKSAGYSDGASPKWGLARV
jgi:hypothetical protein